MNKKFSNIVLSLSTILALSGCGSNSDYKSSDNSNTQNPSDKAKGLEGMVITDTLAKNVKVCFDNNKDGLCQDGEDSVLTDENGKYSFEKEISDKHINSLIIAQINETNNLKAISSKNYTLSTEQISNSSQNITVYTTLLANENRYNLLTKNNISKSKEYLKRNLQNINSELLDGGNYLSNPTALNNAKKLIASYEKAFALQSENPLLTVATVVDEVVKQDKYDVEVSTIDDQKTQGGVVETKDKFELKNLKKTVSWKKDYKDETVMGSTIAKDKFINYSKWNNKLVVIDTSLDEPKLKESKKFINVKGERYASDIQTGASEQVLSKVEVSNDGKTIYSLVEKYDDSSKEIGVGIYRNDISKSIPDVRFSRVDKGNNFYNDTELSDISLSSDGKVLLASSNDKEIYVFDSSNLTNPKTTITTSKTPKKILVSQDNKYAFVSLYKRKKNSLGIYDLTTGELLGEYMIEDKGNYPDYLVQKDEKYLFIANYLKNEILKLNIENKNKIVLEDTYNTGFSKVKEQNLENTPTSLSINKNGKHLVVPTSTGKVIVFDTEDKKRNTTADLKTNVNNAFELENNKFIVNYGTNLGYYTLIDQKGKVSDTTISNWLSKNRGNKK